MKKIKQHIIWKMIPNAIKSVFMFSKAAWMVTILTCVLVSCSKQDANESGSSAASLKGSSSTSVGAGNYVFASYNIRQDTPDDTGNRTWSIRRPKIVYMVNTYAFDLFGVQEAEGNQITNLLSDLPAFAKIGIGRDGNTTSEHCAIFYKPSKFDMLSNGTFWLSPGAPTTPTGPSWDADYKRICTWGRFRDKATNQYFFVFNSHFDNAGATARQESANLILSQIPAIAGTHPVVFMGDLNCNVGSGPATTLNNSALLQETWDLAVTKAPVDRVTYNGWVLNPTGNNQIDHVFVTNGWNIVDRTVRWDAPGGILPSDHFPVVVELRPPTPTNVVPIEDSYVRDGTTYQNTNFGTVVGVTVKNSGIVNNGFNRKAYYKFDVSSFANVSQAILRFYGSNIESTAGAGTQAYQVTDDSWTETGIKWSNAPAPVAVIGTVPVNNTLKYWDLDLTSYVKAQAAGDNIATVMLQQTNATNLTTTFTSRESASNKPQLVITP